MIAPGASMRYSFTPNSAGFRWFHTHTFAGRNLRKAQYGGQHGFLLVEAAREPGDFDQEVLLDLHDWEGRAMSSDDGSMNPTYEVTTINGKMLGFGDPIRVKQDQRVMVHVLNSSPTEVHWVALAGHRFQVVALDANLLPAPQTEGQENYVGGVTFTNHQERETLELTEGITSWSEVGFYVFTSWQDGRGVQWVGDHIRPRVRAPDSWHLPVGLSLSTEIGYQRAVYSPDTWTWEISPHHR